MMHSSSSGNHPQVQAAAGRAVVGDPSSAAASAAVHPRARDSGSSEDPPRSNATRYAGERPSDEEEINSGSEAFDEAPLPRATANIDAVLPPLASYDAAADDEDAPIPPAQIGADHERRDAAIKESIKTPSNVEDAPMHPSQIAAHYGNMEKAIKESIKYANSSGSGTDAPLPPSQIATLVGETEDHEEHGLKKRAVPTTKAEGVTLPPSLTPSNAEDAPMHPSQIAADFGNMFETIKDSIKDTNSSGSGMDAPLPPSQMAALIRETEDDEEYDLEKKAAATTEADGDTPPPSLSAMPQIFEQEETLQQEQDPPTPAVAREPSPPPMDQGQRAQQQIPVRPPPLSMMPSPDEDGGPPVSAPSRDPSVPMLEATPVEDKPETPVYDAVQVAKQTWLKKNKKYIYGGLGLLVGAVIAGVSVGSKNRSSDSSTSEPEGIVLSSPPSKALNPSFRPSISFSPSEIPSSSLRPSLSSPPSTYWSSLNWNRQGLGFNGDASEDLFGEAVALSADTSTMAIGAPGPWGNDDRPGYVKIYGREGEGSSWEQRGGTIRGEANGDNFGHSVALSEDGMTLSVGAPLHDSVGPDSGQVKVYKWDEATLNYAQIGSTLYGAASGDLFGSSLDISSGKILAVGADESDANGSDSGRVTIYAWDDASSNFKQRGEAIDGDAAYDYFGTSVSLAGNGQKLAVGAYGNGQVRVFEWDEATSNYEQLGDPLLGDAAGDWFGLSVSFSRDGTALVIGAPYNSENGLWSGQVNVFAWDETASNFEQIGQSLYGEATYDEFGWSVALSLDGKTLAIGARQVDGGKPGYVEVYEWDEDASEYKQLGQSLAGKVSFDYFGEALALAGNGRDLAVGAPYNDRNGTSSGRVEVFHIEL